MEHIAEDLGKNIMQTDSNFIFSDPLTNVHFFFLFNS